MESYDVIIIGAGPAGLSAALELSKHNKKVLILERNKELGMKVCAGGLTNKTVEFLKLPEHLIEHSFSNLKFHAQDKTTILAEKTPFVYTIDRKKLTEYQLSLLNENIKILKNTKITQIKDNKVLANDKEYKFKYLIGADGSHSIVRDHLNIKSNKYLFALQYTIKSDKLKDIELFFDSKLFKVGYAWIFPHKDYICVGCGCNTKYMTPEKLRANFEKWLSDKKIDVSKSKIQADLVNYKYNGIKFDNIFLCGDASGITSGISGEGIYQALVTGQEAAKMILDDKYDSKVIKKLLKTKRTHNFILNIIQSSGIFRDWIYTAYARSLKHDSLRKIALKVFA